MSLKDKVVKWIIIIIAIIIILSILGSMFPSIDSGIGILSTQ